MELVTFVYSLPTEKEKQTEALKNKEQNQLDKYSALIQKQMKKEKAFLSYKKVEFLSRQEAKLGGKRRSLSACACIGNHLPEITRKAQPKEVANKNGRLVARTERRNLAPFISRQRTHFGMVIASSKPRSTNICQTQGRKSCLMKLTGSNSPVIDSTHNQKEIESVHFKSEAKRTRFVPKYKNSKPLTIEGPKKIENETLRKRRLALPKWENPQNESTKAQEEKVSEDCRNLKEKESKDRVSVDCSRKGSYSFGKAENPVATKPFEGSVNWAAVARLIGLKTKFKRRRLHGTFQAPELEVLDPSLKIDRRFGPAKPNDPWNAVKGCRYLRMPTRNDT